MGNAVSELCMMLCKYRCQPSAVASLLTFFPPDPPLYHISDTADGGMEWILDPMLPNSYFPDVQIHIIKTRVDTYIPAFLFKHPEARYTVIFSHGNAADCGVMREQYIQLCRRLHVNVLGYDYTGYGSASGTPSEANTYADIEAVYDFLVSSGVCTRPDEQVILYGQSVGSGPSCKLAASKARPVRGMILHSPIMSGLRVITENRGPLCCCDIYPNINRIKKVSCPVLVIHGDADDQVHIEHGRRLHNQVPDPHKTDPLWVEGGNHNDIAEIFNGQYIAKLQQFFGTLAQEDESDEVHQGASPRDQLVTT